MFSRDNHPPAMASCSAISRDEGSMTFYHIKSRYSGFRFRRGRSCGGGHSVPVSSSLNKTRKAAGIPPRGRVASRRPAPCRRASRRVGGGQVGRTGNGRTIERPCSLSAGSVVAPTRHTKSRRSLKARSVQN